MTNSIPHTGLGLGLECSGLGLGLECSGLGLGLVLSGLVNIPDYTTRDAVLTCAQKLT